MHSISRIHNLASSADEIKISQKILRTNYVIHLAKELVSIYIWAEDNKMHFNVKKLKAMSYEHTKLHLKYREYSDLQQLTTLQPKSVRDLRIYMCNDTSF